ncbi:Ig-like domain-containing protein [Mycobacterium sp. TJFP1]
MAAASPRKPRRTSGRHRKPSTRTPWLGVGAVGFGLAAALISGQGVASAAPGDASNSQDSSAGTGDTGDGGNTVEPGAGTVTSVEDEGSDPDEAPADDTQDDTEDVDDAVDPDGDDPTNDEPANDGAEPVDDESEPEPTEEPDEDTSPDTPADDQEPAEPSQDPATPAPSTESSAPEPEATESSALPESGSADTAEDSADPVTTESPSSTGADASDDGNATAESAVEVDPAQTAVIAMVKELLKAIGITQTGGDGSSPLTSIDELIQGLWLAGRQDQQARATQRKAVAALVELVSENSLAQLGTSIGWIPVVGTAVYGVSFLGNLVALGVAVLQGDGAEVADELRDLGRDLIGMVPVVGAPVAGTLYADDAFPSATARMSTLAAAEPALAAVEPALAAAAAAPVGSQQHFLSVLQRAVSRLVGWPGTPRNFVDVTNYQTDQTLDLANNQLDGLYANAPVGSQARWLPDMVSIVSLFFIPSVSGATFTDKLNAMGDFLNRVIPPFTIADGAGTFDIISPYKIMGAAVVGTATVLKDMLNGIYDPVQIEIDVIKATTGATVTASDLNDQNALMTKVALAQLGSDPGAFGEPTRAWDVTLPTWTEAQVNPYTLTVYVALVGIYKRFQEMAALTTFTTWTTYDSWHYTNGLGMYAAGTFHAVDPDGGTIEFRADGTLGKTYTTEGNALVTINTVGGGFTYTPPAIWDPKFQNAAFFHRSTAEDPEERFDWVTVEAYSADGVPINIRVGIEIIDGTNAAPTYSGITGQNTDALGVLKGRITGNDADGDTLKYYLVESSVNGMSGNSAYTKNGSGNGGIVTLSENGDFTYVSNGTAGATQSFQVRINDGHHGNTIVTVTVTNTTSITPANVNTSTQNVVTGTVPNSTNKPGAFVSYTLGTSPTKGSVTSFNSTTGAFTYVRDSGLGHGTTPDDFVTVIATDADGRQVTLRMAVAPTVSNAGPTVVLTTQPTVGTLSGTTQTSTGKLTYSDLDGDAPVWTTATSSRGATITFAADGTFTYTSNLTVAQRHAVARIGAAGSTYNGVALAAWEDAFTATVSDGFGGTAQVTVKVPIYAINANPTIGTNSPACGFGTCTVTATTTDPDGDDLSGSLNTSNNGNGDPWYTLARGSVTINAGNQHTFSWTGNSNGLGTQQTGIQIYTVYDGHYRVTNGVVDTSYFARAWVQWNNTTRTFGN